jgi:hypothetical protein
MDNSLSSYLTPIFLATSVRGARFFYEGKHVWDIILCNCHSSCVDFVTVQNTKGKTLKKEASYQSGKGFVERLCEPFHSPLRQFLQDHMKDELNHEILDMSKLQVKILELKKTSENSYYYSPIDWEEKDTLSIPWDKPWELLGDVEKLKKYCRNDKKNLPIVINELYKESTFRYIKNFMKKSSYRQSLSLSLKGEKNFVFLKNGAIFDYRSNKILAENLDTYICSILGISEPTWEDYMNYLNIKGIPLKFFIGYVKTVDSLETSYNNHKWNAIKRQVLQSMPFLQASWMAKSASRHVLEFFVFDSVNGKMESYELTKNGFQRTFDKESAKGKLTQDNKAWRALLTMDEMKAIQERPGLVWYSRIRAKHWTSSLEPVMFVL